MSQKSKVKTSTPKEDSEEDDRMERKLQSWPVWTMFWGKAGTDVLAPEYYFYNNMTHEQSKTRPHEFGMLVWSNGSMTMQGQAPPRRRRPKLPPGVFSRKVEPEKWEAPPFLQHPLSAVLIQKAWRCHWARHEIRVRRGIWETIQHYNRAFEEFQEESIQYYLR